MAFNKLTDAEAERLAILAEELGEAQQAVGKILRHGYLERAPARLGSENNKSDLEKEMGDVICIYLLMTSAGDLNELKVSMRAKYKATKIQPYLHHQNEPLLPKRVIRSKKRG